jgi:hypothetical protein
MYKKDRKNYLVVITVYVLVRVIILIEITIYHYLIFSIMNYLV